MHDHREGGDHDAGHHHGAEMSQTQLLTAALESLWVDLPQLRGWNPRDGWRDGEALAGNPFPSADLLAFLLLARLPAGAWVRPDTVETWLLEHLVVVENTPAAHNAVVCTLCSCYPWAVLGLPPTWYKEPAYRSRMVIEPRAVLREFGLELDGSVEVRVWDSSAEQRYLVLPERPAGTEGMAETELARLVSRDSMIGVARAAAPARAR